MRGHGDHAFVADGEADDTEDAVIMAALQNRQTLAATMLNMTRQSDQFMQSLLR